MFMADCQSIGGKLGIRFVLTKAPPEGRGEEAESLKNTAILKNVIGCNGVLQKRIGIPAQKLALKYLSKHYYINRY